MNNTEKVVKPDDRTMNPEISPGLVCSGQGRDGRPCLAPVVSSAGPFAILFRRLAAIESINFWLTNRIPRVLLTRLIGWYSVIESERLTRLNIAVWRLFSDLDLSESPPMNYRSLREVFTRPLLPGKRPLDAQANVWSSPSDAIVGANGTVHSGIVFQAKGAPYSLRELLGAGSDAINLEGWNYVTLRLTSAMYHRFHAPTDLHIHRVDYISGDVFNVNPPALQRIPSLFCRNERAVVHCVSQSGHPFMIVAVAAVLVASIQLHCISQRLSLALPGHCTFNCDFMARKGEELGWFEQGSTLILLYPGDIQLDEHVQEGGPIRMGQRLLMRRHEGGVDQAVPAIGSASAYTPIVSSD